MKTTFYSLSLFILFIFAGLAHADGPASISPAEEVRDGVQKVLLMLQDKDIPQQRRRSKLHAVIGEHFDFDEMAKRIMAQNWRKLDAEQQKQFISGLVVMLENIYFKAITSYTSETVNIGGERMKSATEATVIVTIVRANGSDIPLLFKLHKSADRWLAYDANVENISLVSHYRNRFNEIMAKDGVQGVLDYLKQQSKSS